MNFSFPKDLLVIDFETSHGVDDLRTQPVQLGAILLDKEKLAEKDAFSSFISADMTGARPEFIAKKAYNLAVIANAPTQSEVMESIVKQFGKNYFISAWVAGGDRELFRKMVRSANIPVFDFDFHYYDIWPLAYTDLLSRGYKGGTGSEEMFQAYGLPARGAHDALEDCRHAAEVLRKILNKESLTLK